MGVHVVDLLHVHLEAVEDEDRRVELFVRFDSEMSAGVSAQW